MLRLIPVVRTMPCERTFDWAPSHGAGRWVALGANASDDDIACVVAELANYNYIDAASGSLADVAHALETAESLILPGGLMAHTAALEIYPSCCCGLEGWRAWYDVAPGGLSPWLGHDPSPWVECDDAGAVLWADSDRSAPHVPVPYPRIDEALRSAHLALVAFVARLTDWLAVRAPQSGLARRFVEAFETS
jgi:hypothetical protein